jgi:hypothetical protein
MNTRNDARNIAALQADIAQVRMENAALEKKLAQT